MQPLATYIRNRNNPDSKITSRPISQSNKGATEERPKCPSHNKDNYFQGGHADKNTVCSCSWALRKAAGWWREDGDEPNDLCSPAF
jgi:hypothetical protein